jgi:hypothetical protein
VPSPKHYSHWNVFFLPVPMVVSCLVWIFPWCVLAVVWKKTNFCAQTKLKSAATIARSGVPVIIVKCESTSAEQALRGGGGGGAAAGVIDVGTILSVREQ